MIPSGNASGPVGVIIVAALAIMVPAPLVGAVLAFTPNAGVRKSGRWLLAAGWLACAAAVIACIWYSRGEPRFRCSR